MIKQNKTKHEWLYTVGIEKSINNREYIRNSLEHLVCSTSQLWWWFYNSLKLSKLRKLNTLKGDFFFFWYVCLHLNKTVKNKQTNKIEQNLKKSTDCALLKHIFLTFEYHVGKMTYTSVISTLPLSFVSHWFIPVCLYQLFQLGFSLIFNHFTFLLPSRQPSLARPSTTLNRVENSS